MNAGWTVGPTVGSETPDRRFRSVVQVLLKHPRGLPTTELYWSLPDEVRDAWGSAVAFGTALSHHPVLFERGHIGKTRIWRLAPGEADPFELELAALHAEVARVQRVALYRWYDGDSEARVGIDRPAYVGVSYNVLQREAQHNHDLREFMEGDIRRRVEWFETREEALAAEAEAIRNELPVYNITGRQP